MRKRSRVGGVAACNLCSKKGFNAHNTDPHIFLWRKLLTNVTLRICRSFIRESSGKNYPANKSKEAVNSSSTRFLENAAAAYLNKALSVTHLASLLVKPPGLSKSMEKQEIFNVDMTNFT